MGQTFSGNEEAMSKDIESVVQNCYETHFQNTNKQWTSTELYRAVSQSIEEVNKKFSSTQLRIPSTDKLQQVYKKYNLGNGKKLTSEEFRKILQEVIIGSGFTGFSGIKDIIIFLYGLPLAAFFVKQRIAPKSVPNDIFIPIVTSATVFLLSKLNKI